MRHLMSPLDLSVDELNTLLDLASDIEKHPDKYGRIPLSVQKRLPVRHGAAVLKYPCKGQTFPPRVFPASLLPACNLPQVRAGLGR